jgi:hypothetical protein
MIRSLLAIALLGVSAQGMAQTMQATSITMVRTGWNDDAFAVVPTEAVVNPANCQIKDGYISHRSLPGYTTYYAAALTAYMARRSVVITVHNSECYGNRPKLIGINLQ